MIGRSLGEPELARKSVALSSGPMPPVTLRPAVPDDFGWVVERHRRLYAAEHGWDATFGDLVASIIADYVGSHDPDREAGWIAIVDSRRAGCIFCIRSDDETAKLRVLLVEPWARGRGVGSTLVDTCVSFARAAGYRRLVLWTVDTLVAARRLYERAGFTLVDQSPTHAFGHDMVDQQWELGL